MEYNEKWCSEEDKNDQNHLEILTYKLQQYWYQKGQRICQSALSSESLLEARTWVTILTLNPGGSHVAQSVCHLTKYGRAETQKCLISLKVLSLHILITVSKCRPTGLCAGMVMDKSVITKALQEAVLWGWWDLPILFYFTCHEHVDVLL